MKIQSVKKNIPAYAAGVAALTAVTLLTGCPASEPVTLEGDVPVSLESEESSDAEPKPILFGHDDDCYLNQAKETTEMTEELMIMGDMVEIVPETESDDGKVDPFAGGISPETTEPFTLEGAAELPSVE